MQLRNEYTISSLSFHSLLISNEKAEDTLHWDTLSITDFTIVVVIRR